VRTMTMRAGLKEGRGGVQELSHVGGIVRDEDGEPVADAWVALPALGRMATSNADGRFRIARMAPGTYEVHVRGRDGREATAEVAVPGGALNVTLAATAGRRG
jgi:protocatechuate 3,4-dioxygenase beta subunit